jgi:D-tyrosyl-tRNA(Tyr) deacylase
MRALVQRAIDTTVRVDGTIVGAYEGLGLCVLLGVTHSDTKPIATKLAQKIWHLRCFEDDNHNTNLSVAEVGGQICLISQFTLFADTSRGRRPSWTDAAAPDVAKLLIKAVETELRSLGATVSCGVFGANMKVSLTNDGPMTLMLDVDA